MWVDETGRHEGTAVAVLADGSEAPAVAALGGNTAWWDSDGTVCERAVAVKGACDCGWRGGRRPGQKRGEDARLGPFADWEYHVTTVAGLIPRDVQQMLAALHARTLELAETQPVMPLRAVVRLQDAVEGGGRTSARVPPWVSSTRGGRSGFVERAVAEHGEKHVGSSSREAEEG